MREAVDQVLARYGGVASRQRLLTTLSVAELDDEIRRGRLVRMFRRAYCRPWDADLPEMIDRAALASVGAPVSLSHLSACIGGTCSSVGPPTCTSACRRRVPCGPKPGFAFTAWRDFRPWCASADSSRPTLRRAS